MNEFYSDFIMIFYQLTSFKNYQILLKTNSIAGSVFILSFISSTSFAESMLSSEVTSLPTIKISAEQDQDLVKQGYLTTKISQVGPWEGRSLQDVPYSIQIANSDLIKNLQASASPDEIYRVNPVIQMTRSQFENDQPTYMSRGFKVSTVYRDGLPGDQYGHGTTMEDTERLEMLNGLSGFLYGPANVGGMVNYVSKRSTDTPYNEIQLASLGGKSWYTHADFGGKFDEGKTFGYRLNLAKQGGETAIDRLEVEKEFASLSLDWAPTDRVSLQVDAMKRDYEVNGNTADWKFADGVNRLAANQLSNDHSWGQPWMNNHYESEKYGANLKWSITDDIALRASYLESKSDRETQSATNTMIDNEHFNQMVSRIYIDGEDRLTSQQRDKSSAAYIDFKFNTGAVEHTLTAGLQNIQTIQKRYPREAAGVEYINLNINQPIVQPAPVGFAVERGEITKRSHNESRSWLVGDDIRLNEQWSALLGVAYVEMKNKISGNETSQASPNISIIYKPWDTLTTYATYIEALENGGTAPDRANGLTVINAGQTFDPLRSKQIELGTKYQWNDQISFNTAIYRINKGLQYSQAINANQAVYVQDGREIHQGIELSATGKITNNWSVIAGYTWVDAEVEKQKQNPDLEGKHPIEVAENIFKVYAEYQLPQIENLSVSAGLNYTGERFADNLNTDRLPSFTLINLGARYQFNLEQYPVTLRLNINNVLDKKYWANATVLGDPRTTLVSATFRF